MGTLIGDFMTALFREREQRTTKSKGGWRQLIRDVAAGKKKNAADVLAELDRLGRSPEDLAAAIKEFQRRSQLAASLAAVPDIEAEIKKHEADRKQAEEEIAAVCERHEPTINFANHRIVQLQNQLATASSARDSLLQSGYDPDIEERIAALKAQLPSLEKEIADRKERSRRLGDALFGARNRLGTEDPVTVQLLKQRIQEEFEPGIREEATTIQRLQAKVVSIYSEIESERGAYLDPACVR